MAPNLMAQDGGAAAQRAAGERSFVGLAGSPLCATLQPEQATPDPRRQRDREERRDDEDRLLLHLRDPERRDRECEERERDTPDRTVAQSGGRPLAALAHAPVMRRPPRSAEEPRDPEVGGEPRER